MNATDVTNLINSKIEGLKQEIEAKYASLAGNNIFTGTNTFNSSMSTNSSVNHQNLPSYRGSSLVDRSYLSGKNYATRSYVSSSVSGKYLLIQPVVLVKVIIMLELFCFADIRLIMAMLVEIQLFMFKNMALMVL